MSHPNSVTNSNPTNTINAETSAEQTARQESASGKAVSFTGALSWLLGIPEEKLSRGLKQLKLPIAVSWVAYCLHAFYDECNFLGWFVHQIR